MCGKLENWRMVVRRGCNENHLFLISTNNNKKFFNFLEKKSQKNIIWYKNLKEILYIFKHSHRWDYQFMQQQGMNGNGDNAQFQLVQDTVLP